MKWAKGNLKEERKFINNLDSTMTINQSMVEMGKMATWQHVVALWQ
jgi:hypothetical protein